MPDGGSNGRANKNPAEFAPGSDDVLTQTEAYKRIWTSISNLPYVATPKDLETPKPIVNIEPGNGFSSIQQRVLELQGQQPPLAPKHDPITPDLVVPPPKAIDPVILPAPEVKPAFRLGDPVPDYQNSAQKAQSFQQIYAHGKPTGITEDVRSTFKELPDKTFIVGGFRENGHANWHDKNATIIRGQDVAYVQLHGGSFYSQNQTDTESHYRLTTPLVKLNGDDEKTANGQRLVVTKPADWPQRGLDMKNYESATQGEKNYVQMARELTERNPRWIVANSCNQNVEGDKRFGATPKVWDEMILLPKDKKRLEFVVMNEPGLNGWSSNSSNPIGDEKFDKNGAGKEIFNAPQLYKRTPQGWEDRGTFITNRSVNNGVDAKQLEQFEIHQMGAEEYARRMKAALASNDRLTTNTLLDVRPGLATDLRKQVERAEPKALEQAKAKSPALGGVMGWIQEKSSLAYENARSAINGLMRGFGMQSAPPPTPTPAPTGLNPVEAAKERFNKIKPGEAEKVLVDKDYSNGVPLTQLRANQYEVNGKATHIIPEDLGATRTITRGEVASKVINPVVVASKRPSLPKETMPGAIVNPSTTSQAPRVSPEGH